MICSVDSVSGADWEVELSVGAPLSLEAVVPQAAKESAIATVNNKIIIFFIIKIPFPNRKFLLIIA